MKFDIVKDENFGYKRLEPIPNDKQLQEFYYKKYYELKSNSDTGSIDRFAKLEEENEKRKKELEWLEKTEYKDFYDFLTQNINSSYKQLLDVGCGTGEFLNFMSDLKFKCTGIEPSKDAAEKAKQKGICVCNCDLLEYYEKYFNENDKFNVINLNNVLEHIADPLLFISKCRKIITEGGIIRIKVPNDFNKLQLDVEQNLNKEPWWISIPDHINYFDFDSLSKLVSAQGFEILYKTVDFPMELFLLMGKDYLTNNDIGRECHEMRKSFELNVSTEIRSKLYENLASMNLGRNIIIYARAI